MRVLLETDEVGGVWTFALSLASAMSAHGVEAELAQVGPADPQRTEEAAAAGVPVHRVGGPLEWQPGVAGSDALRAQGAALAALAAERSVDVLHTCSHAHAGRLATRGETPLGIPVVHTAHSDVLSWWRSAHGASAPSSRRPYARGLREAVANADAVVVPSRAYGRALAAVVGDARPFRVIHNGVAPMPGTAEASRGGVLAAARFDDATKNGVVLAEAGRRLGPRLRLAGTGLPGAGDAAELGRLGRAAMREELRSAAVFAGPARFEPFGLGVLEAAAAGCALVLADQSTHRELWGGVADFVDPDDPSAWADALERRLADPAAAGAAALERSSAYGLDATAAAYATLYAEAVERLGGAGAAAGPRREAVPA